MHFLSTLYQYLNASSNQPPLPADQSALTEISPHTSRLQQQETSHDDMRKVAIGERLSQYNAVEKHLDTWVSEAPDHAEERLRKQLVPLMQKNAHITKNGDLCIENNLNLSDCTGLTSLPNRLKVSGSLELKGCTGLTSLPSDLQVGCDLNLKDCTNLTSLPNGLQVGSRLHLNGCTGLTSLIDGLKVNGFLNLEGCINLTSLPNNLQVRGNLILKACTRLSSLPNDLQVGGHLNLEDCSNLTSLPQSIINMGPCSDGTIRRIDLMGTGLSIIVLRNLETPAPGIQFIFRQDAQTYIEHETLEQAIESWATESHNLNPLNNLSLHTENWGLGNQESQHLKTFLSRLHQTADAQNPHTRASLEGRVQALLQAMETNTNDFRSSALERISQGLESCDDRVILMMNDIEKLTRIQQARSADNQEAALTTLGRSLLALEVVHQHAAETCEHLRFVDPIEVYLAYEIGCRKELDLPVSTQLMLFERCAQVTPQNIKSAVIQAKIALSDTARVTEFFNQWQPMQQCIREQAVACLDWACLDSSNQIFDTNATCLISGTKKNEIKEPVVLKNQLYELSALMRHWIQKGDDPTTRQEFCLSDISRL